MISIEIDERPLSLDRPGVPDYVGRMIHGALYQPLMRWDSVRGQVLPGSVAAWESSRDGRAWRLHFADTAVWSDGRPIKADDALLGLAEAATHPFWCRFLNFLEAAGAEDDRVLELSLSRPLGFLEALLTAIDLAPKSTAGGAADVYSGSYVLAKDTGDTIQLAPNLVLPSDRRPGPLRFVVNRDPAESLPGFAEGRWDVTSATGVPPQYLAGARGGRRREALTGIFVQVEFPPTGRLFRSTALRCALSLAIDADESHRTVPDGVRPSAGLGPACFPNLAARPLGGDEPGGARALWRRTGGPDRISVGYNPYYPNRELIAACERQWRRVLGVRVAPVPFPFGAEPPADCDAVLALRFPAFPHPWSVLDQPLRLAEAQTGRADLWSDAARWLQDEDDEALTALLAGLAQVMPVVPLGEIVSHWVERETVQGFAPGAYASVSLTELRRSE